MTGSGWQPRIRRTEFGWMGAAANLCDNGGERVRDENTGPDRSARVAAVIDAWRITRRLDRENRRALAANLAFRRSYEEARWHRP